MWVQVIFVPFLPPPSHFYTPSPPGLVAQLSQQYFSLVGIFPFFWNAVKFKFSPQNTDEQERVGG